MPRTCRTAVTFVGIIAGICLASSAKAQESLNARLTPYLAKYNLPALAAAVVKDGKILAAGAVGTRRHGQEIPVSLDDRFHLGSNTKAMTSLIAAMFVEEGKLRWDSTVVEIFPDLGEKMDPGLRNVRLEQLLSHTSGIPSDNLVFMLLMGKASQQMGNLDEQRYWLLKRWGEQKLAANHGNIFSYSNMNYIIAGAMLERIAKKTWDELIVERVFTPLNLKTAGLGPQSTIGKVDAPLGHALAGKEIRSYLAGPNGDNPLVIGPAGIAHMSILDFARWAGWNAGEGKRGPHLVKPESLRKLHTPVASIGPKKDATPGTPDRGGYGFGWATVKPDWSAKSMVFHGGSNTRNLAHIWLDPEHDFAMVIVTNIGGEKADHAFQALAPELYSWGSSK